MLNQIYILLITRKTKTLLYLNKYIINFGLFKKIPSYLAQFYIYIYLEILNKVVFNNLFS